MKELLYGELVDWYRLIDPPADHAEETEQYRELIEAAAHGRAETLLELGAASRCGTTC
ncbi:MAG: hypothetical protein ACJ790_21675 [Myxococcaceae bacterium]